MRIAWGGGSQGPPRDSETAETETRAARPLATAAVSARDQGDELEATHDTTLHFTQGLLTTTHAVSHAVSILTKFRVE